MGIQKHEQWHKIKELSEESKTLWELEKFNIDWYIVAVQWAE